MCEILLMISTGGRTKYQRIVEALQGLRRELGAQTKHKAGSLPQPRQTLLSRYSILTYHNIRVRNFHILTLCDKTSPSAGRSLSLNSSARSSYISLLTCPPILEHITDNLLFTRAKCPSPSGRLSDAVKTSCNIAPCENQFRLRRKIWRREEEAYVAEEVLPRFCSMSATSYNESQTLKHFPRKRFNARQAAIYPWSIKSVRHMT